MKFIYFLILTLVIEPSFASPNASYVLKTSENPRVLTLKEAIAHALLHNISLKKHYNHVLEARAKTHHSFSKLVPDLSAKSSFKAEPAPRSAQTGLELNVPLVDARAWMALKASSESKSAADLSYAYEKDQLIYKIADLYCEALIARSSRDVLKEGIEKYRKQSASFENKMRAGAARNLDILEARYQLNVAEKDLIDEELSLQEKLGELGQHLALSQAFLLSNFEVEHPSLSKDSETLRLLAQESLDLQSLKKEISSHGSLVLSESFELIPRIYASFEQGWQWPKEGSLGSSHLMLNLSWPLFNLGTFANAEGHQIRKANNELTFRQKSMEKELSVNSAIASIKAYEEAQAKNATILELASLAATSTERIFNTGDATGLEVIEAHTKVFSAKSQMQEDNIKLKQSKLRLLFLIGKISEF